jgi:hypothetical protein
VRVAGKILGARPGKKSARPGEFFKNISDVKSGARLSRATWRRTGTKRAAGRSIRAKVNTQTAGACVESRTCVRLGISRIPKSGRAAAATNDTTD